MATHKMVLAAFGLLTLVLVASGARALTGIALAADCVEVIERDTDYEGSDLFEVTTDGAVVPESNNKKADTAEECRDVCRATDGCEAWTFVHHWGVKCLLKKDAKGRRELAPRVSGNVCRSSGNVIFITGGYGTETSTEVLDPAGSCSRLTSPLPGQRYAHSLSRLGDDLILCGGEDTGTSCISTRSPDGPWVHHSQLTTDRYWHAGVATGETIHVFGGLPSGAHDTSETLEDLDGARSWKKHQLPNSIGYGPCAVEINNAVYITGGSSALTQTWKWNTDQQWTRLADMDGRGTRHHGCAAVIVGGHSMILVAGGTDEFYNYLRTSAIYDIEENTWRPTGELNQDRDGGVMINVDADVYMLGGMDGSIALNTVEKFNVATNEWVTTNFTMKRGRHYFAAVSVERSTYC